MSYLRIESWGHACFRIVCNRFSIVLDPYMSDSVPGLPPLSLVANYVLCSHGHPGHCNEHAVEKYNGIENPFTITKIESVHDEAGGALCGTNTIHRLDTDDFSIAHLGDQGALLSPKQMEALLGLDVLIIPIGGYFTINAIYAKYITDILKPRIVIPMDYYNDCDGIYSLHPLHKFVSISDNTVTYAGNVLEIDNETISQTAIFDYRF